MADVGIGAGIGMGEGLSGVMESGTSEEEGLGGVALRGGGSRGEGGC